jgi:hypothetical protein
MDQSLRELQVECDTVVVISDAELLEWETVLDKRDCHLSSVPDQAN